MFGEVDYIAIGLLFKLPAMHLPGCHKVYFALLYFEAFKVDNMRAGTLCKVQHVIEAVLMRQAKVTMLLQVRLKAADENVLAVRLRAIDGAIVICRYCLRHCGSKGKTCVNAVLV